MKPYRTTLTVLFAVLVLLANPADAQTGQINDTGQVTCYTEAMAINCDDGSVYFQFARQHSQFGRDGAHLAGRLTKDDGGDAQIDSRVPIEPD